MLARCVTTFSGLESLLAMCVKTCLVKEILLARCVTTFLGIEILLARYERTFLEIEVLLARCVKRFLGIKITFSCDECNKDFNKKGNFLLHEM